jgi:hypothetical protein
MHFGAIVTKIFVNILDFVRVAQYHVTFVQKLTLYQKQRHVVLSVIPGFVQACCQLVTLTVQSSELAQVLVEHAMLHTHTKAQLYSLTPIVLWVQQQFRIMKRLPS